MSEDAAAVAEGGDRGDDFQVEFGTEGFESLGVLEVVLGNTIENVELVVSQDDAVVADLGGSAEDGFDLGEVLGDLEVLLQVEPAAGRRCGLGHLRFEQDAE